MNDFLLIANIFNFKSSLSFAARLQYQYTKNAIVQNIDIDEDFVKTRSFINSGNRKRFFSSFSFGQKLKGLGLRYAIKNKNLYNTSNSIINLELNDVTSQDYLMGASLENSNKNEIDVKIGVNFNFNYTVFSLEEDLNRTYKTQQYYAMFDYDFNKKLNANTQFDYFVFLDNQFVSNIRIPLWNAAISSNVSNNQNHIAKLVLIDLLDKNVDIYRRSTTNFFEETTSESLGRYIILSYTYRLNGGKKRKSS